MTRRAVITCDRCSAELTKEQAIQYLVVSVYVAGPDPRAGRQPVKSYDLCPPCATMLWGFLGERLPSNLEEL